MFYTLGKFFYITRFEIKMSQISVNRLVVRLMFFLSTQKYPILNLSIYLFIREIIASWLLRGLESFLKKCKWCSPY